MDLNELERHAITIAVAAHDKQRDKLGEPYVGHLARVAARLSGLSMSRSRIIAWLHDYLEDASDEAERNRRTAYLRIMFPEWVLDAVIALTHDVGESNVDYWNRVRLNADALQVKLADVADNSDPERLARLDPETRGRLVFKYDEARRVLNGG